MLLVSEENAHIKHASKRYVYCLVLLLLSLTVYSCGLRENPESLSVSEENGSVPVAEFQDMYLPVLLEAIRIYNFNENWFYAASPRYNREKQCGDWHVYRGKLAAEIEPQLYALHEGNNLLVMLADREDNCFLFFSQPKERFSLVKYNVEGELVWDVEYPAALLLDKGEQLTNGLVTEDGRVYLWDYGSGGSVFSFGMDGSFQGVYTPEVDVLEGIAEGQDRQVYGYCVTGEKPVFVNVENPDERFVCPITPLQVYGGCEDGIYLSTRDGLWQYTPTKGELQRMWLWDDEYVQIEESEVNLIFRGKEGVRLLCQERSVGSGSWKGELLALVSVAAKDSRDYPQKEIVTISRASFHSFYKDDSNMEELVRLYNRQSRKYRVVVLTPEEELSGLDFQREFLSTLEMQLIRGEGPDIIEVKGLDVGGLAEKGAFENLTHYYTESETVNREDILESVWEAGRVTGKDIMVIPCFTIGTMLCREDVDVEDWTPQRFLELVQGDGTRIYDETSQQDAFRYCMGVRLAEHFVDYEKRECHFDSDEFRQVLEGCSNWETVEPYQIRGNNIEEIFEQISKRPEREWILRGVTISTTGSALVYGEMGFLLGYPGWNGAENQLNTMDSFVMNSASRNKEGAWDFLEFVLSEEMQDRISWGFPVRRDSFEKYLRASYWNAEHEFAELNYFFDNDQQPTEEDFARIREMAETAVYQYPGSYYSSNPIRIILEEEAGMYFAGDATIEETVKKIQSRVTLYLNEL